MTPPSSSKQQRATPESSGRLFKILSHPLRQRILVALDEMEEGSPTQLADRLGESVGNVSYHVKVLAEADAIQLVRTEPRRGALEHFYRATWEQITGAAGDLGFGNGSPHTSWTSLHLDEEGYTAVAAVLGETRERLLAIQAEARSRAGGADLTPTEVAILQFERG